MPTRKLVDLSATIFTYRHGRDGGHASDYKVRLGS